MQFAISNVLNTVLELGAGRNRTFSEANSKLILILSKFLPLFILRVTSV